MNVHRPRYSKEEFATRGSQFYEGAIRSQVEADHQGEFVAIDIETGDWELDPDDYAATQRLLTRLPRAQIGWSALVSARLIALALEAGFRNHDDRHRECSR